VTIWSVSDSMIREQIAIISARPGTRLWRERKRRLERATLVELANR